MTAAPAGTMTAPTGVDEVSDSRRRSAGAGRGHAGAGVRWRGAPLAGTDVDALLRNLGCRTLIVTGVSVHVVVPNAVFDAVNRGCTAVVPRDAIAGVPSDYTPAMIRNTLALVATVTTTDDVPACLKRPRRVSRA